jgi:lactoylglutathione lyase
MVFKVKSYEHVGIRVSDRERSISFYQALGWRVEIDLPEHCANEMVNDSGVYINLIFNGVTQANAHNVLQDEAIKYPGMTHAAFVIEDMDALIVLLTTQRVKITDGPVIYSGRRKVLFIRDPDGNVLEFNELL